MTFKNLQRTGSIINSDWCITWDKNLSKLFTSDSFWYKLKCWLDSSINLTQNLVLFQNTFLMLIVFCPHICFFSEFKLFNQTKMPLNSVRIFALVSNVLNVKCVAAWTQALWRLCRLWGTQGNIFGLESIFFLCVSDRHKTKLKHLPLWLWMW